MSKTILGAAFVTACSLLTTGCTQPGPIKVMSFNIRYAAPEDGPNRWELRRTRAIETIRAHDPDLLALQEPLAAQVADLRAALPGYGFVGVGREDGAERGEFVPIFYRRQRFTLIDQGHFWLSEQPEQIGSVGWDAALPRIATWVRLRFNDAPLSEVQVINVHFDHQGERARVESAKLIRRYVEALGRQPVIVLGDFNSDPTSGSYRVLTEDRRNLAELHDAFARSADTGGTYHAFSGSAKGGRIDMILFNRRFESSDPAIDRRDFDGRYPSDHFPVAATLRLRG